MCCSPITTTTTSARPRRCSSAGRECSVLITEREGELLDGSSEQGASLAERCEPIEAGQSLEFGALTLRALHTPGHTAGMLSFLLSAPDGPSAVFTGDTLFKDSVGGVRAPGHTHLRGPARRDHGDADGTRPGDRDPSRPCRTTARSAQEWEHNAVHPRVAGARPGRLGALHRAGRACHADPARRRTTTAAPRPGCAGRTAATTSCPARKWSARPDDRPPRLRS